MKMWDVVSDALYRLDDEGTEVWSRAEVGIYGKDGYDQFARRTRCIWDIHVIENVPPTGNYITDLQRYQSETTPGEVTGDHRLVFTAESDRDLVSEPLEGITVPVAATGPGQAESGPVPGGKLPDGTVDVLRVAWDRQTLRAETPTTLRRKDNQYETRQGDPQMWMWRQDGLLAIRIVPVASGDAVYDDVDIADGPGFNSQRDDYADHTIVAPSDGIGFLVEELGAVTSGGPFGFVTRQHPITRNITVEIARLGRDPYAYDLELPRVYRKYVVFYAMAQALKRDGQGQDLALSQHYMDRFEMGVARMQGWMKRTNMARIGKFGAGARTQGPQLAISLPAYWGQVR